MMTFGGKQFFAPRCGNCMKTQGVTDRIHNGVQRGHIVLTGRTKNGRGVKVKCLVCGKKSTRYSRSARRLIK